MIVPRRPCLTAPEPAMRQSLRVLWAFLLALAAPLLACGTVVRSTATTAAATAVAACLTMMTTAAIAFTLMVGGEVAGATAAVLFRRSRGGAAPRVGMRMWRWAHRRQVVRMTSTTRRRLLAVRRTTMPRPPLGRRMGVSSGEQAHMNRWWQLRQRRQHLGSQPPPPLPTGTARVDPSRPPPSTPTLARPTLAPLASGAACRPTFPALLRPCVPCRQLFRRQRAWCGKCPQGGQCLLRPRTRRRRLPLPRCYWRGRRQRWRRLRPPRCARGGRQRRTPLLRRRRLWRSRRHQCPLRFALGGRMGPSPMCTLRRRRAPLRL